MEGEAPKGGQWTAAMPQDSYTDLEEKLARAQRERDEALEQQTATSEVLRVISSSPGSLEPVFEAMLANATRKRGQVSGCCTYGRGKDNTASPHCMVRRLGWRRSAVAELLSILRLHPFSRESR